MKLIRRTLWILCLILTLCVTVQAAGGSITLVYHQKDVPMAGVQFRLYRVEETFAKPEDAYAQILLSGRAPDYEAVTDEAGTLVFGDLAEGTYLLGPTTTRIENKVYETEMSLYTLPCADEQGNPTSHITVEPKYSVKEEGEKLRYRVLKLWEEDASDLRPEEISIQLFRNGQLSRTVALHKADNWEYSWEETDPAAIWSVVEIVPEGYSAAYSRDGDTFLVTNTRIPEAPTEPGPTEPVVPDDPKLPQTGQLWWPVPLMAIAGMVLFLLGWMRRKESRHEG